MPIQIHNKTYITVAERVIEAGKDFIGLDTEVLSHDPVVIKATVKTTKGTFTGISYANVSKSIEKQSPYEVAETSAVGRALGFAGYGVIEGIASADEVVKATQDERYNNREDTAPSKKAIEYSSQKTHFCEIHQKELKERIQEDGTIWDHRQLIDGVWNTCYGSGWKTNDFKPTSNSAFATQKQIAMIHKLLADKGQSKDKLKAKYQVESIKDLPIGTASMIIDNLMKLPDNQVPERDINADLPGDTSIPVEDN